MTQEPTSKTVLILANSRKLTGRCIAGIEFTGNSPSGWVRPVSARDHGEVSEYERRYEDGMDPKVLDVVRMPLYEHVPVLHQSENWLLAPESYWERVGIAGAHELGVLIDSSDLWLSNTADTRYGLNDRVDGAVAETLSDSLRLIYVTHLQYRVFAPSADFGNNKRRVLATFIHSGTEYRVYVTDPVVEREYLAREGEFHAAGAAYLTVSLAEFHEGFCYKVVAAVIPA